MTTLTVEEAAAFLKMDTQILCRKAREGIIPASKPSRRWVFIQEDLIAYLRSIQKKPATLTTALLNGSSKKCHSTKEKISGGSDFLTTDREYAEALGLPIS